MQGLARSEATGGDGDDERQVRDKFEGYARDQRPLYGALEYAEPIAVVMCRLHRAILWVGLSH